MGAGVKAVESEAKPTQVPPVMVVVTRPPPALPSAVVGRETTGVVAVALLLPEFPSPVVEVTVAVLASTVPAVTAASTCTVRVKAALPTAKDGLAHETVPPAPTAGAG